MTKSCHKPRRLKPGANIGVIAPASFGSLEAQEKGIAYLKQLGFQITLGPHLAKKWGYLAGTDEERASDIMTLFNDPQIDAIFCLRGGYGTMRLLDLLDYEVIRQNPKIFMGYSDMTALHLAFNQKADLVSFHGPMVASDFGQDIPEYTSTFWQKALMKSEPLGLIANPPGEPQAMWLLPGEALGVLTGGNLSLLTATLGTPYEIDTTGKILCLEEIGEDPYRIDRMLTQLLLAHKLQSVAGIVIAVCRDCEDEEADGFTLAEVLQDRLRSLKKPVLMNLFFGHTPLKATLPFGVLALLSSQQGGLVLSETCTKE